MTIKLRQPESMALDAELRLALGALDYSQYQNIRNAFYKAVEGLSALARSLENAIDEKTDLIFDEHAIACRAVETMNASRLGRVL